MSEKRDLISELIIFYLQLAERCSVGNIKKSIYCFAIPMRSFDLLNDELLTEKLPGLLFEILLNRGVARFI